MVLGVGLAGAIFTTVFETSIGANTIYIAFTTSLIAAALSAALGTFTSAIKR
jgi:hypothetical protein